MLLSSLGVENLPLIAGLAGNEWLVGLVLFAVTAMLIGFSVPGVIIPLSFSSGALLGGWAGAAVVIGGAAIGSQAFFLAGRRWLGPVLRRKYGAKLVHFDHHLAQRGFVYLLGLRIAGAPHFLVTAAGALSPIGPKPFALATMLGFAPAIALAATAGAAF